MRFSQAHRLLKVHTRLGEDTFLLTKVRVKEQLSQPFECQLTLLSPETTISTPRLLKQDISFSIGNMPFHGRVLTADKKRKATLRGLGEYELTVVPRFYFLKKRKNVRIFTDKNVLDIVTDIFSEHQLNTPTLHCTKTYPKQKQITQFQESDFDFVSRLLEEAGIFYYFTPDPQDHQMILCDDQHSCPTIADPLPYLSQTQNDPQVSQLTFSWHTYHNQYHTFVSSQENPGKPIKISSQTPLPEGHGSETTSSFYRPQEYANTQTAQTQVNLASYRKDTEVNLNKGESNIFNLHAGTLFQMTTHPLPEANQAHFITSIEHLAEDHTHLTQHKHSPNPVQSYQNQFTCLPSHFPPVPPLTIKMPRIQGFQMATVSTPGNRVVSPHDKTDIQITSPYDKKKIPINARLLQAQAHRGYGQQWIPRSGESVLVIYHNGNMDEPLVMAAAYNAVHSPAFDCPAQQTHTGFKTQSFLGSETSTGSNALIFKDDPEQSAIYLQAQKDFQFTIDGTEVATIQGNQSHRVEKGDETLTLTQGEEIIEANHMLLKVGSSFIEITPSEMNLHASHIILQGAGGDPVMPVARLKDPHQCPKETASLKHVGGKISQGSSTVFINGQPAARQNDPSPCHITTDKIKQGASSVFMDNLPAARQNDPMQHGGKISQGSPNVSAGGGGPSALKEITETQPTPFEHANVNHLPKEE